MFIYSITMRYSNDEERAAAKRAAKKKYYEKNKGKYRMWAMQWRHENQPPLYIQETARLERELVSLEESYERKKAVIEQHLERLGPVGAREGPHETRRARERRSLHGTATMCCQP
jgi:hypothetical protein